MTIKVCTYNIHKGFSQFNRRMVIHELRDRLRTLEADVVFLQEVQGMNLRHETVHTNWPPGSQHEFLAHEHWHQSAYGQNALYDHGHHGNAILSRFDIVSSYNQDVSDHRFERRGLLHCEVDLPGGPETAHCFCVHLGLTGGGRRRQMEALADRVESIVPPGAPLIIAGDFNDWLNRAEPLLASRLNLVEVFRSQGRPARSFPCRMPMLALDRIYVRGFEVKSAEVHSGALWGQISDHAPLTAWLELCA